MIEVKNLTKKYGSFTAVDDISFQIEEGQIIGLLGPNGAGKSTTMNMITGFIEPTKGEIIVDGYNMASNAKKAKRAIGYMPENVPLYMDLSVKEFVTYMGQLKMMKRKELKEAVAEVLKNTGLVNVQNKLIRNLSRGYKQRVSLAGALMGNTKVLILDEPTVGLDPEQITEIRNLIKSLGKNHTIILSSHILSEVSQICEKVIIINRGKLVAIDTPMNLEEKVKEENAIIITVEDKDKKMDTIQQKIEGIKSIKLIKDNQDGTKEYILTCDEQRDIRKKIFEVFAKEGITIFEMKKSEVTLEDAFLKLIKTEGVPEEVKTTKKEKKVKKENKKEEIKKVEKEKTKKKGGEK